MGGGVGQMQKKKIVQGKWIFKKIPVLHEENAKKAFMQSKKNSCKWFQKEITCKSKITYPTPPPLHFSSGASLTHSIVDQELSTNIFRWGGSRGGSDGSVEPPKVKQTQIS